jgi:hypothetical protein
MTLPNHDSSSKEDGLSRALHLEHRTWQVPAGSHRRKPVECSEEMEKSFLFSGNFVIFSERSKASRLA